MLIAGVRNKFIFSVRSVIKQEIKSTVEGGGEVLRGSDRGAPADTRVIVSPHSIELYTQNRSP